MGQALRWDFIIERTEQRDLVARDSEAGTVVARGRDASELVGNLLALLEQVGAPLVPWSAVFRTRPDGRVVFTSFHRMEGRAAHARNGAEQQWQSAMRGTLPRHGHD